MNALVPIDSLTLDTVTGGASSRTPQLDSLLGQLGSLTSSLNDFKSKTNGLGSNEMLMLCMLAMQNRSASSVVYVGSRRPGCWW